MNKREKKNKLVLIEKKFESEKKDNVRKKLLSKKKLEETVILLGYSLLGIHTVFLIYRYAYAIQNLMKYVNNNDIMYILCMGILPFMWWVYSTKVDYWHFHQRKLIMLHACVVHAILVLAQPIWTFSWEKIVKRIVKLEAGRNFTREMIIELARNSLLMPCLIFVFICMSGYRKKILNEINCPKIAAFRIQHIIDFRKNKRNLYDLRIMKDIKLGRDIVIEAGDRSVHTFVLGASGTGKTSSVLEPMIIMDMNKKVQNMKKRVEQILQMIKQKKVYVAGPYTGEVDEKNVKAYPRYEKELSDIRKKYPDCGITFMAPNNDLNNRIVKAGKARGMKVNVIDPLKIYKDKNVNNLGINPFYVPLEADLYAQQEVITNTAAVFSEVLNAVNESGNESNDIYFKNLNTSVTMNVATICMLFESLHGRYTYLSEIQDCITDFSRLEPIVEEIMYEFGLNISVSEGNRNRKKDADRSALQNRVHPVNNVEEFIPKKTEDEIPEKYRYMSLAEYNKMLKDVAMGYKTTIYTVLYELLGPGREKMEDQSRGLRNIIGNLLQDPRINRILNAQEENFIKFDKILENEITVVNTGLAISQRCSTALGLFFQLCLKISVLRRPEEKRSMHFLIIDEASQYMNPMYEDMVALYRQYGVNVTIAMQATSQMSKNSSTRYLHDVVMGVGTHIVFGRTSAEEMDLYSKLAGLKDVEIVQSQISKNSLIEDSPQYSEGIRRGYDKKNLFEGVDIRKKDFQEVTVFTVREGRVLNPIAAKVAFVPESEYYDQHVRWVDFKKLVPEEEKENLISLPTAEMNKTVKEMIEQRRGGYCTKNEFEEDDNLLEPIQEQTHEKKKDYEEGMEKESAKICEKAVLNSEINFAQLLGFEWEREHGTMEEEGVEQQIKQLDGQSNNRGLF